MKLHFLIISILFVSQAQAADKKDDCDLSEIVEWTVLTGRHYETVENNLKLFNGYLLENEIRFPSFKIKAPSDLIAFAYLCTFEVHRRRTEQSID